MNARAAVLGGCALVVTVLATLLWPAGAAHAATFTVNSTDDGPDFLPGNGVCDSTSGGGVCTLRAAINESNATAGPDVINLPAGTYLLTLGGASEDAGQTGDLDILDDVTILGASVATTIVDGNLADRVFEVRTSGIATLRDLTV